MRLIDADELTAFYEDSGEMHFRPAILSTIRNFKTVDAALVVKGKWKEHGMTFEYHHYECSLCKGHNKWSANYCPNCGAKME